MNLSKSKYCNAVQCPKMLWLSKYKKEVYDDSVLNQAVLEQGSEVGDLAMGLFGDFTEVPFGDLSKMITETNYLIESGTEIITEASFAYKGLFCSVDILKNKGGGHVELYEVKSSSEVHGIYYDDVAYQCYVLKLLGYIVDRACVVHINTSYVRNESLDLEQLFIIADITAEAEEKFDEVDANIEIFGSYMEQKEEPIKDISMECFNPYECGYFKYCTRNLPTPNVFDVARLSKKKKFEYYNNGVISFKDLYEKKVLTESYVKQVEHEVLDAEPYIDVDAIKEFMENLSYPIYFLDFETFSSPIPLYKNSSPYQQIPFQYSLHYIEYEDAVLQHKEFLAQAGTDPRRALAERLCSDIPKDVCVTAYNMGFEKGRIKELARMYTDLAEHLMNIHDNIVDLMIPFQKKQYYQKEMQGSYSIKYVLPALFPDDPELNYANLEGIHNGSEASNAFRKMVEMEPKEVVKYREHLLNYCKLDTYAMVKIWHKLNEVISIKERMRDMGIKDFLNDMNNLKNDFIDAVADERNIEKNEYSAVRKPGEKFAEKYIECSNCGEVLRKTAKFCDQCGAKVEIKSNTTFMRNCGSEKYGEVQGIEKWWYFGEHTFHRLNRPYKRMWQNNAFYNDKFYYDFAGYVWESNADGTQQKIIMKEPKNWGGSNIFVNSYGIYLISESEIRVFDFSGQAIDAVNACDILKCSYICNDKIFMVIREENSKRDKAIYYDIGTHKYYTIYEGYYEKTGENSRGEKSIRQSAIQYIMANEKRVVLWLDFMEHYYPEDEEEESYESEASGWYSYDLETKKLTSLNWVGIYPHQLATLGAAAFEKKANQRGHRTEERIDYYRIAYFNMERDLMWTIKSLDGIGEIWEPREIGSIKEEVIINNHPLWNIPETRTYGDYGLYFDGERRYQKENDFNLFAYDYKGNKSNNWIKDLARDMGPIRICGEYIFVINDDIVHNREHQYKLEFQPGPALRVNWMCANGGDNYEYEKKRKEIIDAFEKQIPGNTNGELINEVAIEPNEDVLPSKQAYWKSFIEYATESGSGNAFLYSGFTLPKPADRNWYALRLGTAKARIELQINTKNNIIRTALFIKDENMWNKVEALLLSNTADSNKMHVDTESKTPSISIYKPIEGMDINKKEQYDWFMEYALVFKHFYDVAAK